MAARQGMKIGFLGAGNMAEAFVRGLINAGVCAVSSIYVSDVRRERLEHLKDAFGVNAAATNRECLKAVDVCIIAVKPQNMETLLGELRGCDVKGKLVMSIAAGITTRKIEESLGGEPVVIRVMPNTPSLIGEGISVWARGRHVSGGHAESAGRILGAVGDHVEVREELMNAATAVSGSGPAYVFYLLEALSSAGVQLGFNAAQALRLAVRTLIGAGRLAEVTEQPPEELRKRVTSPGGTTAAAIRVLDERKVKKALIDAVRAACKRAGELSGEGEK